MNQHITVDQAKEIYPQMTGYLASIVLEPKGYTALAEWLTIGRMIEMLENSHMLEIVKNPLGYIIEGAWNVRIDQSLTKQFMRKELADALFMAVKEVLK